MDAFASHVAAPFLLSSELRLEADRFRAKAAVLIGRAEREEAKAKKSGLSHVRAEQDRERAEHARRLAATFDFFANNPRNK